MTPQAATAIIGRAGFSMLPDRDWSKMFRSMRYNAPKMPGWSTPKKLGIDAADYCVLHWLLDSLKVEPAFAFNQNVITRCVFGHCQRALIRFGAPRADPKKEYWDFVHETWGKGGDDGHNARALCRSYGPYRMRDRMAAAERLTLYLSGRELP